MDMKRLFKSVLLLFTVLLCTAVSASAEGVKVEWNMGTLTVGELSVSLRGAEDGLTAVLALYDGDTLVSANRKTVENSMVELKADVENAENGTAKLMLWDWNGLRPVSEVLSVITPDGVTSKQLWVSDDQRQNKPDSVAYHDIAPALEGKYAISFDLTVNTKGDNAILFGDSSNGPLEYANSSAILLIKGDNLIVRDGNRNGGYESDEVNLCPAEIGKVYTVVIEGDMTTNIYIVSVTDEEGNTYTSDELFARKKGSKLDTAALISNRHKTIVEGGNYSDYNFYIRNFHTGKIVEDPGDPIYDGFAGMYYGITVNGKYIRGNMGKISVDYEAVSDTSAHFLPRDMADGTFSLLCRSSNRRITTADLNSPLPSGDYATNDKTQHWYLEESENYTPEHLSYYLRSADNDVYIGLSGGYLAAVNEADKVELVFDPLPDESPLYLISRTEAYAKLTAAQRERMVTLYETLAGDVFGRYGEGDYVEWTVRGRLDKAFNEILSGVLSDEEKYKGQYENPEDIPYERLEDAQYAQLVEILSGSNAHLILKDYITGYTVSTSLPGTENLSYKVDEGTPGSYELFWDGSKQDGTMYTLEIYDGDEIQQILKVYVQDDEIAELNFRTFLSSVITKIPYVYRRNIRTVKVRNDDGNSFNCGLNELFIRLNYHMGDINRMLGTLTHEMNHSLDAAGQYWSHNKSWAKAMADDMIMATDYARASMDEDFAEFGRLYVLCYGNQDRRKALQVLFPNRYASYRQFRHTKLDGFELWEDTEYLE